MGRVQLGRVRLGLLCPRLLWCCQGSWGDKKRKIVYTFFSILWSQLGQSYTHQNCHVVIWSYNTAPGRTSKGLSSHYTIDTYFSMLTVAPLTAAMYSPPQVPISGWMIKPRRSFAGRCIELWLIVSREWSQTLNSNVPFFLSCVKSRGNYGHESEVGVLGMRREETGWERKDRRGEKHIPDTINVCW